MGTNQRVMPIENQNSCACARFQPIDLLGLIGLLSESAMMTKIHTEPSVLHPA